MTYTFIPLTANGCGEISILYTNTENNISLKPTIYKIKILTVKLQLLTHGEALGNEVLESVA